MQTASQKNLCRQFYHREIKLRERLRNSKGNMTQLNIQLIRRLPKRGREWDRGEMWRDKIDDFPELIKISSYRLSTKTSSRISRKKFTPITSY